MRLPHTLQVGWVLLSQIQGLVFAVVEFESQGTALVWAPWSVYVVWCGACVTCAGVGSLAVRMPCFTCFHFA